MVKDKGNNTKKKQESKLFERQAVLRDCFELCKFTNTHTINYFMSTKNIKTNEKTQLNCPKETTC